MLAISIFHFLENFYFEEAVPQPLRESPFWWIYVYARALSISGFNIVVISSFLMGHSRKRNFTALYTLLALGLVAVGVSYSGLTGGLLKWEWDIYAYLIVGCLPPLIATSLRGFKALYWMGYIGLLLLLVPFWKLQSADQGRVLTAIVGNCTLSGGVGWPLLPWVGLIWAPWAFGALLRQQPTFRCRLRAFSGPERWIWLGCALLTVPELGHYFPTPIGAGFACFMNQQPLVDFWAHFFWMIFVLRLSLVDRVQLLLESWPWVSAFSKLQWNRRFGICYVVHLPVIAAFSYFADRLLAQPWLVLPLLASIFTVPELLVRGALAIKGSQKTPEIGS